MNCNIHVNCYVSILLGHMPRGASISGRAPKLGGRLDSGRASARRARPDISGRLGLWFESPFFPNTFPWGDLEPGFTPPGVGGLSIGHSPKGPSKYYVIKDFRFFGVDPPPRDHTVII